MIDKKYTGFLGRGWKFPPEFSRETGGPLMSEAETDIKESLVILLSTSARERVMQSAYGCNLAGQLFEAMNVTFLTMLKDHVTMSIKLYEPRIELLDITMLTENLTDGILDISISYYIRNINRRDSIVYPFFLNEGTHVAADSFPLNP